nr:hypothetical protein [Bartonella gabonensis]
MKKLYTKLAGNDSKFSRFPFIKVLSLTSIVAILSSVSPVFSKTKEEVSINIKDATVWVFPQSVISVYDDSSGYLGTINVSQDYLTVLNTVLTPKVNASVDDKNFLNDMLSEKRVISRAINSKKYDAGHPLELGFNSHAKLHDSIAVGLVVEAKVEQGMAIGFTALSTGGKNSIAIGSTVVFSEDEKTKTVAGAKFAIAFGTQAHSYANQAIAMGYNAYATKEALQAIAIGANTKAAGKFAITMGDQAEATREDSIAIGRMAHALGKSNTAFGSEYNEKGHGENDYTTVSGDYSTALGAVSKALAEGATAVGHRAYASEKDAVSIGFYSEAKADHAIALGADSIANVAAGVQGYNPLKAETDDTFAWKSTYGAVGVSDVSKGKTRQIGGVAEGTEETDAVNIAQLKSLQTYVDKGWKLSVDGKNAKVVGIEDTVDLSAGSENLQITKGEGDNKVKFDLAKNITLDSVTVGENILDTKGLKIANGPQITTEGINASGKKMTGVAAGTDVTDAVNFGQLQKIEKDVKEQVAATSFVKQDAETQHITIGKDTGGDKIDIANNKNDKCTLTGIKAGTLSEDSNEAVIGSQLFETNNKVASYLGGGAEYKDGAWTAPTFKVNTVDAEGKEKSETYHNVSDALRGVGSSFTNLKNEITKEVNNTITTVKGDSLLWSETDKAFSAQHENDGAKTNSKIAHLLDGDISEGSIDAITGNQLYLMSNQLASYFGGNAGYKDGIWTAPTFTLKTVKKDGTAEEKISECCISI